MVLIAIVSVINTAGAFPRGREPDRDREPRDGGTGAAVYEGRKEPLVRRAKTAVSARARVGGWATAALITLALLATLLGGGRAGHATVAADGSAWLWSRTTGEVGRVNPDNGRVERTRNVPGSRGHRVQVTQNDQNLLIHDLETGRVSSLNLSGLGFSGQADVGTRDDPHLAMGNGVAAVVERTSGQVRALDPATLRPTGPVLQLPGPLTGGEFDGAGLLWTAVPRQGTVTAVKVTAEGAAVAQTVEVAEPDRDLALTVLDEGALVVDRGGRDLVAAIGGGTRRITAPVPLAGALVPERTHGGLAAITVPAAGAVVTLDDVRKGGPIHSFPLRDPVQEPAVPFAGKVYVPVRETGQVRVYAPTGEQTGVLNMPSGRGDLELQVREGNLFVNAPGSADAQVIGADGRVRTVGKYPDGKGRGGDKPVAPGAGNGPPPVSAPPADPIFPDPPDLLDPPGKRPTETGTPEPPRTEAPGRPESPKPSPGRPPAPSPSLTFPRPTSRPTTGAPTSHAPTTKPPTTKPPWTRPPTTRPPTTRPPTTRPPTTKPPSTKPPSTKPPTTKPPASNPYTAVQVCNAGGSGSGYKVQRSSSFSGGRIYQLYSATTKNNCAVTMKTADIGKGTNVWVRLQSQKGGKVASDNGTFKYYAGPVYVHAPGDCVRYSGGASGASASAGWANCG
ncbi:hypothetical protein [Spirillospora sp. CA-128828]|uniref:hypothetical protein n=1 Tax=Spirillospora sp. CA-128828 TaxID=3240033 RepID=UPI003D93C146